MFEQQRGFVAAVAFELGGVELFAAQINEERTRTVAARWVASLSAAAAAAAATTGITLTSS